MAAIAAAIGGSAALGAGSSLLGSGKSSSASKSAAEESYYSTLLQTQTEQNMYNQATATLQPFVNAGEGALSQAQGVADYFASNPAGMPGYNAAQSALGTAQGYQQQAAGYLQQAAGMTPPSVVTEQWLQNTPGYQFQLQQGLKSTQAAAAARGLGVSGASLKGAATYATGLADANYQNQYANAQTAWQDVMNQGTAAGNLGTFSQNQAGQYMTSAQLAQAMQQQVYNQYYNIGSLGESAAAKSAQNALTSSGQQAQSLSTGAQQYGNYLQNAGQAQAAGTTGVSNAVNSGINNYLAYQNYQNYGGTFAGSGTGGFGGTSAYGSPNLSAISSAASGAGASGNAYVDPSTGLTPQY